MKAIAIVSVVDIVEALAKETLSNNIYLMDNNKSNGSLGLGTDALKTMVKKGDKIIWTTLALECEAFASISDILIDKEYCEPKEQVYEGTDINYWVGTMKQDPKPGGVPYNLRFTLGNRVEKMSISSPSLIGRHS